MKCDFSYRHYLEILEGFKKLGYKFSFFDEQPEGKVVYLRHDLDTSVEKAVLMADLERSVGAKATYCLRVASPFDNLFSKRNREAVKKLVDRGHSLALHFEREAWEGDLERNILDQLNLLRSYFPVRDIVSFHRPQDDILNKCFEFINTYDKPFFKEVVYLSDSTGTWRSGCPCVNLDKENKRNYQFLTHPIWWGRDEENPCKHLHNFLREKMYDWDRELYDDNPFYIERLK